MNANLPQLILLFGIIYGRKRHYRAIRFLQADCWTQKQVFANATLKEPGQPSATEYTLETR